MERNSAFIDVKFRRLKRANPGIRCFALAEAPDVEVRTLERVVGEILGHADKVMFSLEALRSEVSKLGGAS
jgi:hypothetical protein